MPPRNSISYGFLHLRFGHPTLNVSEVIHIIMIKPFFSSRALEEKSVTNSWRDTLFFLFFFFDKGKWLEYWNCNKRQMSLTLHQKRVGMSWRICQPGWHVLAFSREFFCTQTDVLWYFANHLYVWKDNYININPNIKKLYRDLWRSFRLHALLLQTDVQFNHSW